MPTALRIGPYRFFFYASDRDEPLHIHVEREKMLAKFWLSPVRLQYGSGFNRAELTRLEAVIQEHREALMEAWNDHFSS